MSNDDKRISISILLEEVSRSGPVAEALDLYQKALSEDGQFEPEVLMPILMLRIRTVAEEYNELERCVLALNDHVEELLEKAKELIKQMAQLVSVIMAGDEKVLTTTSVGDLKEAVATSLARFEGLVLSIADHGMSCLDLSAQALVTEHESLSKLYSRGASEPIRLQAALQRVDRRLSDYQKAIAWKKLKEELAEVIDGLFSMFDDIRATNKRIQDRKTLNPSDTINVRVESTLCVEKVEILANSLSQLINFVYQSVVSQEQLLDAIRCYRLILSRLMERKPLSNTARR